MEAVVVLTDSMNRQWIYKSHDYVPAMRQARILEMTMRITRTNDETGVLASADKNQRRLFHFEVELRAQIVSSSTILGLESVGFMLGHCKSWKQPVYALTFLVLTCPFFGETQVQNENGSLNFERYLKAGDFS
jgi:hypothetical protein